MTVLQIKNSIMRMLSAVYQTVPVYGEGLTSGLEAPAFYVRATASSSTKELNRRRRRSAEFDIQYLPADSATQNDTLYTVGEALLEKFEYVSTDEALLRPISARYEITGAVLHCYLTFQWFALADTEKAEHIAKVDVEVF